MSGCPNQKKCHEPDWLAALAKASCVASASLLFSCTGVLGEGAPGLADGTDEAGQGGTAEGPFQAGGLDCSQTEVGPTAMRRLTSRQYANAVRDLLGVTAPPEGWELVSDEQVAGYFSNTNPVSPLTAERHMTAAEAVVEAVALDELTGCGAEASVSCVVDFLRGFGRRAYRRPLQDSELTRLGSLFESQAAEGGTTEGLRAVLEAMLQSPHFLYHVERVPEGGGRLDDLAIASRLAFLFWDAPPDEVLLDAAEAGELGSPDGLEKHATRMLADSRARSGLANFAAQWLDITELDHLEKSTEHYPEFSSELAVAMREESETFFAALVQEHGGNFEDLLTADFSYVPEALRALYGLPAGDGLVDLPAGERIGILTHPSFLAVHSHPNQPSLVRRGHFVRERIFCQTVPAPPPDVDDEPPPPDPNALARDNFARHREDPSCKGCHELMDPLGHAFESFDGIGAYREYHGELEIDPSGELLSTDVDGAFEDVTGMMPRIAESEQARSCFTANLMRAALGRLETQADYCGLNAAFQAFADEEYELGAAFLGIVRSDLFSYRKLPEAKQP